MKREIKMATITIKSWTKAEMIDQIFNKVNWTAGQKENNKKRAMRKTYDTIWNIFNQWKGDNNNALFYATLLAN